MSQKYASFAGAKLREQTGLFDDVDAKVVAFKFSKEAPDNYPAEGNPIFAYVSLLLDGDGPEDERTQVQIYNLGAKAGDEFTIGDDGYGLIPVDDAVNTGRKGSKFTIFTQALETAGVPATI